MKAGVAVQLRLAATLPEPNRDVTYVFYECEEVDAARNGLFLLSRDAPELLVADFAVLLEPSGGVVEGGCQGTLRAAITAKGARAHTARSWMGKNAIHEAAAILDVLRAWQPRKPVVDGLEYHEGLNAVAISGGVAGNVVPDECVVTVNYRFAPDRSEEEAQSYIRDLFAAWPVEILDSAPGARPGLTSGPAADFVAGGGRRAEGQARLDRRGAIRRAGHPRRQLRPGHLRNSPHPGRVRRRGPHRGRRAGAAQLANPLTAVDPSAAAVNPSAAPAVPECRALARHDIPEIS